MKLLGGGMLVEMDVLVCDAALKGFAEGVVEVAASAVDADLDGGCVQAGGGGVGGGLCGLVGVEVLGPEPCWALGAGPVFQKKRFPGSNQVGMNLVVTG